MHLDGDHPHNQPPIGRTVTVKEAAAILGISPEAVRARIKRGTLYKEKGADGTVYVRLDGNGAHDGTSAQQGRDELVEELRDRIRYLEEESKRKDSIILTMAQRIPELEAPKTTSEGAADGNVAGEEQAASERRSWWRRWFVPNP